MRFHHIVEPYEFVSHQVGRWWTYLRKIQALASVAKWQDVAVYIAHAVAFVGPNHEVILAEELVKEERRTHVQVPVVAYPIVYHKCQCCAAKSKAADHDEDVMMSEKFLLVIHLT